GYPICRYGAREQVTLPKVAFEVEEAACLILGLDTFGHDPDAEASSEIDHRPNDRLIVGVYCHAFDEALVDLDEIDRELLQVPERGIAGAEIIERNSYAAHVHQRQRAVPVFRAAAEEHRFRHLQLE